METLLLLPGRRPAAARLLPRVVAAPTRRPTPLLSKVKFTRKVFTPLYNTSHVCVAYNGSLSACSPADGQQVSPVAGRVYLGNTENSLRGMMDEVKFYDHALTSEQLSLLYSGHRVNDIPLSVTIESESIANETLQADALTSVSFIGSATDTRLAYSGAFGTRLNYSWSILSSQCGMATISNSTSATPVLSLLDVGSFVLQLCASDGELSSGAQLQVLVTASEPYIITQPQGGALNVPRGSLVSLDVEGNGVPAPTYQWHYLTYVNRTIENTTNPGENTTVLERGYNDDEGQFPGGIEEDYEPPQLHWLNNRAAWEVVEAWYPIEGANSSSYQVNGSHAGINNQTISCLVSSTGGVAWSARYTVNLVAATPSASPVTISGGSSTDIAAIVGGAVGGAVGLFFLLLVVLVVLALVVAKRKGHSQRKLRQPDYIALAYGDLNGGDSFPKRKAEHLARLEQLLLEENGRLAHAVLAATSVNDAEKLCKALMVVFEAHHLGFELLEVRITEEVAAASDEGTLFRANSLAAKLFACYVRLVALPYLFFTLVTSVNSLNDNAKESFGEEASAGALSKRMRYKVDKLDDEDDSDSGTSLDVFSVASSMEIDPHKMGDASDSAINTLELWLAAQKLFKCIINSERLMPTQIKHILMHIDAEVGERFSAQEQFRALGGFLFLRMVCPALMAPQVFGLLDSPPHPVAQRQFILVSKVLQNLANDTLPGAKEAYMEQLDSFIITNKASLEQFYQKLVSGAQRGKAVMTQVPVKAKQRSLAVVHQWLEANLAALQQTQLNDEKNGDSHQDQERLVEQLKEVLASLGDDTSV